MRGNAEAEGVETERECIVGDVIVRPMGVTGTSMQGATTVR
jgi:hypothetical protein